MKRVRAGSTMGTFQSSMGSARTNTFTVRVPAGGFGTTSSVAPWQPLCWDPSLIVRTFHPSWGQLREKTLHWSLFLWGAWLFWYANAFRARKPRLPFSKPLVCGTFFSCSVALRDSTTDFRNPWENWAPSGVHKFPGNWSTKRFWVPIVRVWWRSLNLSGYDAYWVPNSYRAPGRNTCKENVRPHIIPLLVFLVSKHSQGRFCVFFFSGTSRWRGRCALVPKNGFIGEEVLHVAYAW